MHLYNLTLQPPSAITQAIVGNFSGGRQQEFIVSHGTRLELLQLNTQTSSLTTACATDVFGSIRSIAPFRLTGSTKDYTIVNSDSGCIVILEYNPNTGEFVKLHQETYGKSGSRRIVPGQYLATDPKGRSVMIAAIEKAKLAYILNRDVAMNITISSPLEAHASNTIVHHIVGLDVGFDNPVFAALEVEYTASDKDPSGEAFRNTDKMLTYYELDLGLNTVVQKWSGATDPRANILVQVPGGQSGSLGRLDGPSGVLICCEGHVIYRNMDAPQHRVPILCRQGDDHSRGVLIVSAVTHRMKDAFFFLLQSEDGDLFKVTIEHEEEEVKSLTIKYFDTIPTSSSLCITKSGYLFVAPEFGSKCLYQFIKLGDEEDRTELKSSSFPSCGMENPRIPLQATYFCVRSLQNLVLVDEIAALDPIIDSKVLSGKLNAPQIVVACGRGSRSSLGILSHGIELEALLNADIKSVPNGIWSTKLKKDDKFDRYVVLSFTNRSLVLSVGEVLEEVENTELLTTQPTIAIQQPGTESLLQVHPLGIRYILPTGVATEWPAPTGTTIVTAATNNRQVAVALSSTELVYFEVDLDGHLNEYQERKTLGSTILALSLAEVLEGEKRTPYLAIGCEDQTVRIMSLDPERTLEIMSLQALTSPPSSICTIELRDARGHSTISINIGLQNGVFLRTTLDPETGHLKNSRTRFVGTHPVQVNSIQIQGVSALLVLSSRSWLCYIHQNKTHFTPIQNNELDLACIFSSQACPEGMIGIVGSVLRILRVPALGTHLKQDIIPLLHTPRGFIVHPENKHFYIIESDHRVTDAEPPTAKMEDQVPIATFKAPEGSWLSYIRVIDSVQMRTVSLVKLVRNEAAFSLVIVPFSACSGELLLVVGTATKVTLSPRSCSSGFLRTYKFKGDGTLELHHVTEVEDIPLALIAFQGRLVAGVWSTLRIYDFGKTKLLRKAENKVFPSVIVSLSVQGSRIVVGHMQDSVSFVSHKATEDSLVSFADDTQPRWVTCSTMVDYNTVAAADRFGNIFVNRLDSTVSDRVDDDPTGFGHENGTPYKTRLVAHFHVGDIITSLHKTPLVIGGGDILLYTALHGTIGALVPFTSREDIDLLLLLEQHMRAEGVSLVGRDHLSWRGYYVPVKAVVDGDLCESFGALHVSRQAAIASALDRSVDEVLNKLDQLRAMSSGF